MVAPKPVGTEKQKEVNLAAKNAVRNPMFSRGTRLRGGEFGGGEFGGGELGGGELGGGEWLAE